MFELFTVVVVVVVGVVGRWRPGRVDALCTRRRVPLATRRL